MKKIIEKALEAQKLGFTHLASVVKRFKFTTYYHVVPISQVLEAGKWIPARIVQFPSGARGREGLPEKQVNWEKTTLK